MTEWTQNLAMHLRQGGGRHGYSYNIEADGEPTGIILTVRTQRTVVTAKILSKGDDEYDMLADDHTKKRMEAWLEAHRDGPPAPETA